MRTYYRGPDALVTDEHFVWRSSSSQIFTVHELRNVGRVPGHVSAPHPGTVLGVAATVLVVAAASWTALGSAVGYASLALSAVIVMTAVVAQRQRASRRWELQATWRGLPVTLYSSSDVRVFNQVSRALGRSIEDNHQHRTAYGLAAA